MLLPDLPNALGGDGMMALDHSTGDGLDTIRRSSGMD
jgi:hypothetical protein